MTLVECSQILLTITAIVAAGVGIWQLRTPNRSECLRMLEDHTVRKARRLLYKKLRKETPSPSWWEADECLEEAASTVCASFDIVGLMATYGNQRVFAREWKNSICWTYAVLNKYIDKRNPGGYGGYRKLYEMAKFFK
jgi:hypothetical protein